MKGWENPVMVKKKSETPKPGELVPVESSNIDAVGYDPSTQVLLVRFKGNTLYGYSDVPAWVHTQFVKAESKGQYFAKNVKNKFKFSKLG